MTSELTTRSHFSRLMCVSLVSILAAVAASRSTQATTLTPAATTHTDPCLPLTMPSSTELFNSSKKIFAHYFYPFPVSIDNKASATDYYNTQFLNPHGESNKHEAEGGYLRQRPLGVPEQASSANWRQLNMEGEIRAAMARGITGFTYDAMEVESPTDSTGPLHTMLAAAAAVDSRFKIVVMPDLTTFKTDSASVVKIIASVAHSPAAYRLSDGRLVVTAFDANMNSPAWWESVLNQLKDEGIDVAFVPTFLGWSNNAGKFYSFSYGIGDWGTATDPSALQMEGDPEIVHNEYHRIFMLPVGPQQFRPKDFLFWEAGNSSTFRDGWSSAIHGDADWVQMVTWNDFSESGEIEPYTDSSLKRDIGTGYYDLNGYYATWFSTGQQPAITHDVLYYFYRREPTNAAAHAQSRGDTSATGATENDIELVAFLPSAGELKITIDGKTYTKSAPAGITSFKVPSAPGVPTFTLLRNGAQVFSFEGGVQIYGTGGIPSGTLDLTYWSGSASQGGVCSL
jgi:hypothetical protein